MAPEDTNRRSEISAKEDREKKAAGSLARKGEGQARNDAIRPRWPGRPMPRLSRRLKAAAADITADVKADIKADIKADKAMANDKAKARVRVGASGLSGTGDRLKRERVPLLSLLKATASILTSNVKIGRAHV